MAGMEDELRRLMEKDPTLVLGAVAAENRKIQTARILEDLLVKTVTKAEQQQVAEDQAVQLGDPAQQPSESLDLLSAIQPTQQPLAAGTPPKGSISSITTSDWQDAGAGTKARRVNGKLEITNVKDEQGNPSMDSAWYYQANATPQQSANATQGSLQSGYGNSVAQQLANIQALDSTEAKLTAFNELQIAVGKQMAEAEGAALRQAEQTLGVDRLRSLLAANEAVDRRNPNWATRRMDSPDTAQLRQQLDSAVLKATGLANSFLKSNPDIAGLQASMRTAEIALQRSLVSDQRINEREAQKQMQLDFKQAQLRDSFQPQQYRRIRTLYPDLQTKSDEEIVGILANGRKAIGKEQAALMQASDQDLLQFALQDDNQAAAILLDEESQRTGMSKEVLGQRLARLSANMSPQAALKAIQQRYPNRKSEEYKLAAQPFEAIIRGEKLDKEAAGSMRQTLYRSAMAGLTIANTKEWVSDTRNWVWPADSNGSSIVQALAEKAASAAGSTPVSIMDIASRIRSDLPREQWRAARDELVRAVYNNSKTRNGLLTSVDPDAVAQQVDLDLSRSRIAEAVGVFAQRSDNILRNMYQDSPAAYVGQAYDFLFGNPSK